MKTITPSNKPRRAAMPIAVVLLAGLLCVFTANLDAQFAVGATSATGFQGQAAAAAGITSAGTVSVADTGALAAGGGALETAALETNVGGGLAMGASHATVIGGGNATASEASVANVSFTSGGSFFGATTITADFIMSRAAATCGTFMATANGSVQVTGLVINGQAVAATGAASQFVLLSDGGYVIINEQVMSWSGVTVNALHVVDAFAGVNVVIGASAAGVTCQFVNTPPGPSTSPPYDFLTGGGWITGTPSAAKANFGVAGGIRYGAFWGHLNYVDHGTGMHVKATAVTGYAADTTDADCRIINYTVTIDGQPGTARVRACDKGEPGRNDIFEILLSSGYSAGGDLGGNHPGGGNIQLHKPNP